MAVKSSSFLLHPGSVANKDRISQLPEELLLQILSLLETKNVIAMSVVSKLWRSVSKKVPKLKFICSSTTDLETFSDYVCRILLSHQAPVLQSLNLCIDCDKGSRLDIGVLVGIAFGLHVRKFLLDLDTVDSSDFRFPRSMYNSETLETLKLKTFILVDVPFPVCLKSLKTLHLERVVYKNEESFVNLLSGCSRLENLVLHNPADEKIKRIRITVAVPSLQRLTLVDDRGGEPTVYVIISPSLKYLSIKGVLDFGPCLIVNTPELVEAKIDISGLINLGSFTSVKRLSLKSPQQVTYPTGCIFYQLVYLILYSYEANWWNLLTLMLNGSPKLQVLEIIDEQYESDSVANQKWNQPKNVPECLLLHLETFLWKGCKVQAGNEKEVAKYILRNACHLKKAIFSIEGINSEKGLEMLEELESVVRASNSCQLVFK